MHIATVHSKNNTLEMILFGLIFGNGRSTEISISNVHTLFKQNDNSFPWNNFFFLQWYTNSVGSHSLKCLLKKHLAKQKNVNWNTTVWLIADFSWGGGGGNTELSNFAQLILKSKWESNYFWEHLLLCRNPISDFKIKNEELRQYGLVAKSAQI